MKKLILLLIVAGTSSLFAKEEEWQMVERKEGEIVAEFKKAAAAQTVQTKAELVRGTKKESFDFAKDADVKKLKPFDTIELQEGTYKGFGRLTTPHVRIVGKGQDKTYITSEEGKPVWVNGTDLWDMTIVDTEFSASGTEGAYAVACDVAGQTFVKSRLGEEAIPYALSTVLSVVTAWKKPTSPIQRNLDFGSLDMNFDGKMIGARSILVHEGDYGPKFPIQIAISQVAEKSKGRRTYDSSVNKALEANADAAYAAIDIEVRWFNHRVHYKKLFSKMYQYAAARGDFKPAYDEKEFKRLMTGAQAAAKAGHDIGALLLMEKADRLARYTHHDEVAKAADAVLTRAREQGSCTLGGERNYMEYMVEEMSKTLPVFKYRGSSACTITFVASPVVAGGTAVSDARKVGEVDVYQETEASKKKREMEAKSKAMAERAADRAGAKARQARFDAATESMKNTAQKMEQGRVRVEGDQLVSGQGNFAGGASASTLNAYEKNSAEAAREREEAAKPGSGPEMEKVGTRAVVKQTHSKISTYLVTAEMNLFGAKKKLKGQTIMNSEDTNCQSGQVAGGYQSCTMSYSGGRSEIRQDVDKIYIPELMKAMKPKIIEPRLRRTVAGMKSSDPVEKFDALLTSHLYGGKPDLAGLPEISEKAVGYRCDADCLMSAAFSL
ncbi:MAG TPA: hypothetical protein PKC28_03600 [Bdellovibrionales bacterium]|nr:hypothetical protein [Bdellovibrionales bacterium]